MLVACLALVVATAGTSIAATQIGKNEVGAKEFGKVTQRTETDLVDSQVDNHGQADAKCNKGEQLLGGGALFENADTGEPANADEFADLDISGPTSKNSWRGGGYVDDSETTDFRLIVTAFCLAK
jgi:hypothetical protein